MREIKFRLFGKNSKEFLKDKNNYGLSLEKLQNVPDLNVWEISQYTGLKDKNGKEIYEGDIVKCECEWNFGVSPLTGEIISSKSNFIIRGNPKYKKDDRQYIIFNLAEDTWDYEVIGNIYKNANLLKTLDKK